MILTVFYMASTSFQSWRLKTIHHKIARAIDSKNSIVFLKKSDGVKHGMVTALASSEICVNSNEATVHDCFWSNDISQGISISPKQILFINPFITFPSPPSLIPFSHNNVKDFADLSKHEVIHALIEADLIPDNNLTLPMLEIDNFAQMVAWKIDTKLSILVKTNSKYLSQLVFASFVQNHYIINDHLLLSRIQTVNVDGSPQDFDQIMNHSKKDILLRSNEILSPENWDKHIHGIKSLCVLASQASEFEYKKNLTEGKTGIVQPDLISSKTIEESLHRKAVVSPDTPKKSMVSLEKTDEKLRELKKYLKDETDSSSISKIPFNSEVIADKGSPKFPVSPSRSAKNKNISSTKFPIGSPTKSSLYAAALNDSFDKDGSHVKKEEPRKHITMHIKDNPLKPIIKNFENSNDVSADKIKETANGKSAQLIESEKGHYKLKESNAKVEDSDNANVLKDLTSAKTSNEADLKCSRPAAKIIESTTTTLENESSSKFPMSPSRSVIDKKISSPAATKFPMGSPAKRSLYAANLNDSFDMDGSHVKKQEVRRSLMDNVHKMPNFSEDVDASIIRADLNDPIEEIPLDKNKCESASDKESDQNEVAAGENPESRKSVELKKLIEIVEKTDEINDMIDTTKNIKSAPEAPASSETKPTLQRSRKKLIEAKPPNILVYSDSTTTKANVIKTLGGILKKNMYTIYPLTAQQAKERIWLDNTTLLVVCGSINGSDVSQIFLEYFFKGGKILCLCSDLLRQVLPTYHTAEVREHELVQFSYGQWKNIKMMHHIFCYQPSPIRKHFSQDSDDPPKEKSNTNPLIVLPRSIELKDDLGMNHNVHVQILGTEDTWKTPSLLMVYTDNGGKIIFSQIHLEIDPSFYEDDEQKYQILMKNDNLRHEIFGDVLSTHLGLATTDLKATNGDDLEFTRGYFLGRHELKFEILEQLKPNMDENNTLKIDNLSIKFCGKNEEPQTPQSYYLPIMIHSCPDDFSTLDYFDTLKTTHIGRALIYSYILTSTMNMISKMNYCHGLTIVSRVLTQATGRANNMWLSPDGCLMFTLQLHIPLKSPLGQRIPLIQHLIATATVMAIKNIPGYEDLDINVKWPNDIYANGERKIGGLIVNSIIEADQVICNIGLGLNLSNSIPTTSINDMISEYNKKHSKILKPLTLEKTLAIIFNEIENILNRIQADDIDYLYNLYYSCWLHTDTFVKVLSSSGQEKNGKIIGIDEYGFLKIRLDNNQIESVQPDGNSFDMLRGLIVPKAH